MGSLFTYIFDGIADGYKHELNLIAQQYPVEPLKYLRPSLRLTFEEGIQMLNVSRHCAIVVIYAETVYIIMKQLCYVYTASVWIFDM